MRQNDDQKKKEDKKGKRQTFTKNKQVCHCPEMTFIWIRFWHFQNLITMAKDKVFIQKNQENMYTPKKNIYIYVYIYFFF